MTTTQQTTDEFGALECLPDDELLARLRAMVRREYASTARLVAHLAEVDARRLYVAEGYASLYLFCLHELHLSEHAAFGRIKAARVARRFPRVLEELAAGRITLTAIVLLMPHLTGANHVELLTFARGKTRRDLEEMLAARRPAPPADDLLRRLPSGSEMPRPGAGSGDSDAPRQPLLFAPGNRMDSEEACPDPPASALPGDVPPSWLAGSGESGAAGGHCPTSALPPLPLPPPARPSPPPTPPARLSPLDAAVYRVQFTARAETYRRLIQVRELMRHQVPDGDLATIFDRALGLLYQALARRKFALVMGGKGAPLVPPVPPGAVGDRDGEAAPAAPGAIPPGSAGAAAAPLATASVDPASFRLVPPTERRRYIPATVRRVVWLRDGGRCTFTSAAGLRCGERGKLEFHHRVPYARGGPATPANLELRCRAHNVYEEAE